MNSIVNNVVAVVDDSDHLRDVAKPFYFETEHLIAIPIKLLILYVTV